MTALSTGGRSLRDRSILFYPLVLAAFPPVFLYAENTGEGISFAEFLAPLAILILVTALLLVVLRLLIKDSVKAGVVVSILLVVLFSYGAIHDVMWHRKVTVAGVFIGRHRYLLPPAGIIGLAGISLALLYRGNLAPLMRIGAVAALILVLFNVGRLVEAALTSPGEGPGIAQPASAQTTLPEGVETLPDIYYIVLDGYGREDVLQRSYGFDNGEFIESLQEKGFYISPVARSNYPHTGVSLTSSLLMRYLRPSDRGWHNVKNTAVLKYVRRLGYQYVHMDSGYSLTRRNPYADVEFLGDSPLRLLLNDYSAALLESTFLPPLLGTLGLSTYSPFVANSTDRFNENMRFLTTIPDRPGPTFTFNHNLPPHPPYLFDRDGNPPPGFQYQPEDKTFWDTQQYIDQLVYVNKRIEEAVDHILERSPTEPIIIIQGDHGPAPSLGHSKEFGNPSDLLVLERTAILNAYYLPEYCRSGLYPAITPVNTFRLVFDDCLGAHFGLLEDKTYWSDYSSIEESAIDFSLISP